MRRKSLIIYFGKASYILELPVSVIDVKTQIELNYKKPKLNKMFIFIFSVYFKNYSSARSNIQD